MQVFEQIYTSALSARIKPQIDLLTNHKSAYRIILCFFTFITLVSNVYGQSGNWKLEIIGLDKEQRHNNKLYSSKTEVDSALHQLYQNIIAEGYLLARLDTQIFNQTISVKVALGRPLMLQKNHYNQGIFANDVLEYNKKRKPSLAAISEGAEYKLRILENEGYPFASILLDSLKALDSVHYEAFWNIRKGPFVTLDSLVFLGEEKLPERYLRYYLQLKLKSPYSEEKIRSLNRKLSQIPFLQTSKPPEVLFRGNKATLYFHLKKKKNNYFNGILGLRPNDQTGRVNFTGDVEIKLQNALNRAEDIQLVWKRLQPQTQDLLLFSKIPNVLGLPLGVDGKLNIYRRDSTFSTVMSSIGVSSYVASGISLRGFYERFRSSGIGPVLASQSVNNVNYNLYGLGIEVERLDNLFNPRKGIWIKTDVAIGRRNQEIDEINPIVRRQNMGKLEYRVDWFIPTWKRQAVRLLSEGRALFVEQPGLNELYRIGGIRNLRGVDEESLFANRWALFGLEYRFILDKGTALYAFVDQAYYERNIGIESLSDNPLGFGVGFNLKTNGGVFTFNYALAQQFENPILVRNAKISFGFRNMF